MVELAPQPPHMVGPTWEKTVDGAWHLPERSLGWGVLRWWWQYVKTPGGVDAGTPFMPTLEQARFTLWWYAVDENGQFVYREGVLRRMKGWGKDPLVAAISLAELCGPVAFSGFDYKGDPVGEPRYAAWIQIAAVSQDQTKNTFRLFPVMISKDLKTEYGLEVNKFVVYSAVGGHIEAVTSSPASMEGNRPTFVICNEIQWWGSGPGGESNDGVEMNEIIDGNVTKMVGARKLSICNAHIPGYNTVGEAAYDSWMDVEVGRAVDTKKLYDALEAPADTPISEIPSQKENYEGYLAGVAKLREGIEVARGDSYWLPVDDILMSVLDTGGIGEDGPRRKVSEARRKFLNQVNAHEDSWISPAEWDRIALVDPVFKLKKDDRITLGFDGSKSTDWTALVACRVEDGMLFLLKVWDPTRQPSGEVPREEVDAVVRSAFAAYDVVSFRADVKEFEAYIDKWGQDFRRELKVNATPGNPIAFDMRGQTKRFALDCERLEDAVLEREVFHDGNLTLRQHVLNARRHPTTFDAISIRKASKDSSKKIDAAVCAVLAFGARQEYLMSRKNRPGKVVVIK